MLGLEDWSTVPCSLCGHVENRCWPLWDAIALWVALDHLDGWPRERLLVLPAHTVAYR